MTTDKLGRPYARLNHLYQGHKVTLDGGFTCHPPGKVVLYVDRDTGELYFDCADGRHFLSSQLDLAGYLVGVYE